MYCFCMGRNAGTYDFMQHGNRAKGSGTDPGDTVLDFLYDKNILSVFLQEYFMVGKRNRILQTEKHQDTGGDHVCEMRFLAKKYVF